MALYTRISRGELIDRLTQVLSNDSTFWTAQEKADAINEAISVWQAMTGDYVTSFTIPVQPGIVSYDVPRQVVGTQRVLWNSTPLTLSSLYELDTAFPEWEQENLVVNGGFEGWKASGSSSLPGDVPTGWTCINLGATSTMPEKVPSERSGFAVRLRNTGSSQLTALTQELTVAAGATIAVEAWYYYPSSSNAPLALRNQTTTNYMSVDGTWSAGPSELSFATKAPSGGYQRVQVVSTVEGTSGNVTLRLRMSTNILSATTEGTFDDIRVSVCGTPSYWTPVGVNKIAVYPAPSSGSLTFEGIAESPLLVSNGSSLQLSEDEITRLLGYARHYTSFKEGIPEVESSMDGLTNLIEAAALRNSRLTAMAFYKAFMGTSRDEEERPPRTAEKGLAARA